MYKRFTIILCLFLILLAGCTSTSNNERISELEDEMSSLEQELADLKSTPSPTPTQTSITPISILEPSDRTSINLYNDHFTLSWTVVPEATEYSIKLSSNSDLTNAFVYSTVENSYIFESASLDNDTTYYWQVSAYADSVLIGMSPVSPFGTHHMTPITTPVTESDTLKYGNVAEVVTLLDKHSLSNGDKPFYELIGAYYGMKYDVEPGNYRLEIYIYRDIDKMDETVIGLETIDNQVYTDNNLLLLLHTTNKDYLDGLIIDLND